MHVRATPTAPTAFLTRSDSCLATRSTTSWVSCARGWWNVYSDVERAQRVFRAYDACVTLADQRMCEGDTLVNLSSGPANLAANKALALYR